MAGSGDRQYTLADDRVGLLYGGIAWMHLVDPWVNGGMASPGPAIGNTLVAALGIPVGLIPLALGSNRLAGTGNDCYDRRNSDHRDPTTIYGQALNALFTGGPA